ncbi:MAG TPA: hypothetical protein VK463_02130 [Desulfomonilaceae bacterium]|nr:hypothetical protein [Desulfomonilaceae bacterium]
MGSLRMGKRFQKHTEQSASGVRGDDTEQRKDSKQAEKCTALLYTAAGTRNHDEARKKTWPLDSRWNRSR